MASELGVLLQKAGKKTKDDRHAMFSANSIFVLVSLDQSLWPQPPVFCQITRWDCGSRVLTVVNPQRFQQISKLPIETRERGSIPCSTSAASQSDLRWNERGSTLAQCGRGHPGIQQVGSTMSALLSPKKRPDQRRDSVFLSSN